MLLMLQLDVWDCLQLALLRDLYLVHVLLVDLYLHLL